MNERWGSIIDRCEKTFDVMPIVDKVWLRGVKSQTAGLCLIFLLYRDQG